MSGGRHNGIRFPHDTSTRREWREALDATKSEWSSAWHGHPTRAAASFDALHDENPATSARRLPGPGTPRQPPSEGSKAPCATAMPTC